MKLVRDRPAPPVRIVHLGLGNFFRAHQAYYTAAAPDAPEWGIAAFTGRSATLAEALSDQQGLYTLVVRGPGGDRCTVLAPVVAAHPGTDVDAWCAYLADPVVAIVTLTVTEAGYLGGEADRPALATLVEALSAGLGDALRTGAGDALRTVAGRLVAGLAARRAADAGPLAVVCCDNLPDNGAATARVVTGLAAEVDDGLAAWITANVSFVTTMVDRITPATTDEDRQAVLDLTGVDDAAPVVTEPFTEWVLQGGFPAGRPRWEEAGARFVADATPYEQRKLWLLNGGHSLLAYAGSARGHETVAEAAADPICRGWLDEWWDAAAMHLSLADREITDYRAALLERWANPRIRHRLAQIAADGSQKLPIRILPVLRAERVAGRLPAGAIRVLGAWIAHLRGAGAPVQDAAADPFRTAAAKQAPDAARAVLTRFDPALGADDDLVTALAAVLG